MQTVAILFAVQCQNTLATLGQLYLAGWVVNEDYMGSVEQLILTLDTTQEPALHTATHLPFSWERRSGMSKRMARRSST